MKVCILHLLLFSCLAGRAQSPLVKQWDARFGGDDYDYLTSFQQTSDGGFILAGYSGSGISGDKTQPSRGGLDYWIVKTDANGNKQWDRRFGGFDNDILYSVQQTHDGGYMLGGTSSSQAGGDKTQPSRGMNDYWIIKTDSLGIKIWDKRYGGIYDELLALVLQTPDKGYILGGYSGSPAGGDKTQPGQGGNDYWIVKTDSIGTVLWDRTYGGTIHDFLLNMILTNDGGYLLGGGSGSQAGGDKSQNTWGAYDTWIIKTDSLGMMQWDADYGGFSYDELLSLMQLPDDNYVLACFSTSNAGGNKTQNSWGQGDVWLIKISPTGTILWDKDLGGTGMDDGIGSIFRNSDGNFFVSCNSFSAISGDKTENNLGLAQAWVIKTDTLGNKLWDKTIFTDPDQKVYPLMIQTADGCYAIAQATFGDSAGVKSQPNRDPTLSSTDYWIIKYCDSTAAPLAAFNAPGSICPGTCIDFINQSINSTSCAWEFPGAMPSSSTEFNPTAICYGTPGTYDVTLIVSSTYGSDTLFLPNYITVYPFPPAQGINQSGDTLFANPGAVSYQWYHDGNFIPGATDYYYVATEGGNYNVVATDLNGCEVEAAIFDVVAGFALYPSINESLHIFPEPVLNVLHYELPVEFHASGASSINIYSLYGQKMNDAKVAGKQGYLDCSVLSSGVYLFEIVSDGHNFRKLFIKE